MRPVRRVPVLLRADFFGRRELSRGGIQRLVVSRGTDGSNPVPSTGESSANLTSSPGAHLCYEEGEPNAARATARQVSALSADPTRP
jgi:hypothetical protein